MSQPDRYPEEAAGDSERQRESPEKRGREDLRALPFPLGDWGEPAERLEELYRWAEDSALRTADWYLRDRVWKRRCARALRLGAALSTAAGAVMTVTGPLRGAVVALLGAAICVGLDRAFGVTAGWMRDVATAQAVQRRLDVLRFDWASESVREVLGPTEGTAAEAADRCLGVLRRFNDDVSELVRTETADWMVDFHAGSPQLRTQSLSGGWGQRAEGGSPVGRFPLLPGGRPSMPRQRPPEGPRAS